MNARVPLGARWAAACSCAALLALAIPTGCGDDGGGAGGGGGASCASELDADGCFEPSCWTPVEGRAFRADVLPIFERSCALSSACHGDPSSPSTSAGYRPYLGSVDEQAEPSDVAAIRAVLIGQVSPNSGLALVAPGAPEQSYLMHKIDGSLGCADAACGERCGQPMPDPSSPLPLAERNLIRDWIAQGAKDD